MRNLLDKSRVAQRLDGKGRLTGRLRVPANSNYTVLRGPRKTPNPVAISAADLTSACHGLPRGKPGRAPESDVLHERLVCCGNDQHRDRQPNQTEEETRSPFLVHLSLRAKIPCSPSLAIGFVSGVRKNKNSAVRRREHVQQVRRTAEFLILRTPE